MKPRLSVLELTATSVLVKQLVVLHDSSHDAAELSGFNTVKQECCLISSSCSHNLQEFQMNTS